MAKGLRSSRIKANKRALAKKVFAPVEDARTEQLSSKLQQLAAEPKPTKEAEMADVNTEDPWTEGQPIGEANVQPEPMEIEGASERVLRKPKKSGRIQKRGRSKLAQSTVFPQYKKGKRVGPPSKKRRSKA